MSNTPKQNQSVAQAGLPDRTFERGQGCWNCIHAKPAVERWVDKRKEMLERGLRLSIDHPKGQNYGPVVRIRRAVELMDAVVAQHKAFACAIGITAEGNPVGDLVASAYLCSRWTGRDGSSLARIDGKLDLLPEELRDKIDGSDPTSVSAGSKRTEP